ncbi:MAG: RNA polymerase sigma factor [Phycisphaerae bacterium]
MNAGHTEPDPRIAQAITGDVAALTDLLHEHAPRLRALLSIDKRWQSVLDADDVLQVTYLEAFLKIGSFVPGGPNAFLGWLRRIAENNLRDAIKGLDAAKRPPPNLQANTTDSSAVALFDLLGVTSATPSRAAAANEIERALAAALDALPADYARVVRLYDIEGHPIAAVASELDRSAGAVHMLRARAHDQLRELLGPDSQFFSRPA